jgi:hypothetical protein
MHALHFSVAGMGVLSVAVGDLIIAGWTGRDPAAIEHHIAELEALGVKRPRTVPCYYRVGANLLTSAPEIQVVGTDSSGEVEFALISTPQGLFVGVGSDHTDRKVEAYSVTVSKQMCPKPVGAELWQFGDVEAHWDQLMLRSYSTRDGMRRLYQEGAVSRMLAPGELISRYLGSSGKLPAATVMFGGTHAAIGEIAGGERFEVELHDPVRGRSLKHAYSVSFMPSAD